MKYKVYRNEQLGEFVLEALSLERGALGKIFSICASTMAHLFPERLPLTDEIVEISGTIVQRMAWKPLYLEAMGIFLCPACGADFLGNNHAPGLHNANCPLRWTEPSRNSVRVKIEKSYD
jgi:hypothetical protein